MRKQKKKGRQKGKLEKGGLLLQSKEKKEATVKVGKFSTKQRRKGKNESGESEPDCLCKLSKKKGKRNGKGCMS